MQIIQSIRDKGAAIVIVVIALSLIGFILMDAQQGGSRLFSSFSSVVGEINGQEIQLNDFNKKVEEAEDAQYQRSGQRPSGTQIYQVRDQVWNQMVAESILMSESEKLGITVTQGEVSYVLYSEDPSNPLMNEPSLKDSITGRLDPNKIKTALANIKKRKPEEKAQIQHQLIDPIELNKKVSKYSSLISASAYYPAWMQQEDDKETKNFANISFVNIPYTEVNDSQIKITDEDVKDYVSKNKSMFKQEAGRFISYLSFSQNPSATDSNEVRGLINNLKAAFVVDTNAKAFVANNQSAVEYKESYTPQNKLFFIIKDTIPKLSVGEVYGPYVENNNFTLAKLLGRKELPDSVQAKHILIKPGQNRDDSASKKLADSILSLVKSGANFDTLASKYSEDESNKNKGGDLGYFGYGTMVPEFNDFCFGNTAGTKDVVKTSFGYHVINIVATKGTNQSFKIAYMAKEIIASEETINKANLDATRASAMKDRASLEKLATKNGLSLIKNTTLIKQNDFSIGALQDARSIVRWAFEADKGDVSESFSLGDQFVVAVLDKIVDEGTQDVETAKPGCEAIIRNKKKAEIIKKKIGNSPTLEKAAAAYGKTIQNAGADSTLSFSSSVINNVGMEQKVIGAAFNKAYQTKASPVIEGTTGVFVMKVNSIQSKPADAPEKMTENAKQKLSTLRSQTGGWYEALRKQATIVDKRFDHF